MLILTRKIGESIRIGDNVVVKIVSLDNRHVKIGIDAPRSVSVNREEIYQKIQSENQEAAEAPKSGSIQDIAQLLKGSDKENGSLGGLQNLFGKKKDES
jgi:carbon storage regulator